MKALMISAVAMAAFSTATLASECKGLDEAACGSNAACTWRPAHKVGDISPSSGNPYKRDQKAFCRKGAKKAETATATPAKPAQ